MKTPTNPRNDHLGFEFDEPYMANTTYAPQPKGIGCTLGIILVVLGIIGMIISQII